MECIDIKTQYIYFIQGYVHNVPLCLQGADVFSANIAGWKHLPSSAQPKSTLRGSQYAVDNFTSLSFPMLVAQFAAVSMAAPCIFLQILEELI